MTRQLHFWGPKVQLLCLSCTLLATPAEACHRFSVWKYPWPQRCGLAPTTIARHAARRAAPKLIFPPSQEVAIPLPTLEAIDWGAVADDDARGRLELKAILEPQ
jgi:hypothetical protein